MYASEFFEVEFTDEDDWFDPILNADTELFIDPFLVFQDYSETFVGAHDQLVAHFDRAFRLIAQGNLRESSLAYKKALDILVFKEPKEICLGYTGFGTSGAGSGRGFAKSIAAAICNAIQRGLEHPTHFEELGIFEEGIGADRISDITCTILKRALIAYTQAVAERHNIPLEEHELFASGFDEQRQRWITGVVSLPTNPATGGPLLLVPKRFLRKLPVLNADDWWDGWENQQLRDDLNYELMGRVNKKIIVETALQNPEAVREWIASKENEAADFYDFESDPDGVWKWNKAAGQFVSENPLQIEHPNSDGEFIEVIEAIIGQFKLFIEEQGGWSLLWNDDGKEKPESAAQLVFRGIAEHYCRANNISLDREVNFGRGPVDFKFSTGFQKRAHLEVKKLHNGKFWNGLDKQLPSYMKSDEVKLGWFMAVRYRDGKNWDDRIRDLPDRVATAAEREEKDIRYKNIDTRPVDSASKL